jgi:NTE family protein
MNRRTKKIGLALGGGGGRGLAHVGFLRELYKAGITFDVVSGTSIGGIFAACYALGISIEEMENRCRKLSNVRELMKLVDMSPPRRGLLEGAKVREYLAQFIDPDLTFHDTQIPLSMCAVDLISCTEIVLDSGNLLDAVMATISLPGLFSPVEIGDYRLVDGGLLNYLPAEYPRRLGADMVVAVDVMNDPYNEMPWQELPKKLLFPFAIPEFFLDFYRAELIMVAEITMRKLRESKPDILIRPPIPADVTTLLGFTKANETISAGERAALDALPAIMSIFQNGNRIEEELCEN